MTLELETHAGGVAVHDRNAVTRSRDSQTLLLDKSRLVIGDDAQDLTSFGLEFILLARDERHNIVHDVHGRNTRVAGARDSLHRDDGDGGDGAESSLKSGKRDDETDDGAVGVADQETLVERANGTLVGDKVKMGDVDGGNDERNERIATVVFGVGEDGDIGLGELQLCKSVSSHESPVFSRERKTYRFHQQHQNPAH